MDWKIGKTYKTVGGNIRFKLIARKTFNMLGESDMGWANFHPDTGKCNDFNNTGACISAWDLVPEDQYVPWTADTIPHQPFYVRNRAKDHTCGTLVSSIRKTGVVIDGQVYGYDEILRNFVTIDGVPCGRKV